MTDDCLYAAGWAGDKFKICLDAQNDGWFAKGEENCRITVSPTWMSGESSFRFDNYDYGPGANQYDYATTDSNAVVVYSGSSWVAEMEIAESDLFGVTFSASTQLRMNFQINDRDTPITDRSIFDIFTGAAIYNPSALLNGLEPVLYCVDFTLVN